MGLARRSRGLTGSAGSGLSQRRGKRTTDLENTSRLHALTEALASSADSLGNLSRVFQVESVRYPSPEQWRLGRSPQRRHPSEHSTFLLRQCVQVRVHEPPLTTAFKVVEDRRRIANCFDGYDPALCCLLAARYEEIQPFRRYGTEL